MKVRSISLKPVLKVLLSAAAVMLLLVLAYFAYVFISYNRIADNIPCQLIERDCRAELQQGEEYCIVTQNIGYGAYSPDYSFFMDGGTESWANSPEEVRANIALATEAVASLEPDFILFQEVDFDSTRSFHIDQKEILAEAFAGYCGSFAVNYHSPFLAYPILEPHGFSNSGLLTLSNAKITSATRRSLPISESLSKLLDLDRCYTINRIPVSNGKELVLINLHASAFGGNPEIREMQMSKLFNDMKNEYEKGNYCICGGDFNHDFTGNSVERLNGGKTSELGWTQPFPESLLPEGIVRCDSYTGDLVASCRNCDVPYEEGNFTVVVDGFLASENVELVELQNIDNGFAYSDHNPVRLVFILK